MHFEATDFEITAFVDAAILKDFAFSIYFMLHVKVPDPVFVKVL